MSANSTFAPTNRLVVAVEEKVNPEVKVISFPPSSKAKTTARSADVPELTAIACFTPTYFANKSSNSLTNFPPQNLRP